MSRRLSLNGLLLHDSENRDAARVLALTGWDDTAELNVLTVPNTGGAGVRTAGTWTSKEKYPTVSGRLAAADRAAFETVRAQLLAACPIGQQVELVLDDDLTETQRMFVYRADQATVQWANGLWVAYTLPLVAADPFKYPVEPVVGVCGVFLGQSWFREYAADAPADTARAYRLAGGRWVRTYAQNQPIGLPDSVQLLSDGDVTSERVTVTVTGPLDAGDWYLTNLVTGEQLYADLSLVAGQNLVFDCYEQTAFLNGTEDVTTLAFGDWLTLPPGASTFQLVAGTDSDASATFSALPASE
ncbi:MAG TPA: hypothetical protein VFV01_47770 [Spirillospora sp.]|nr:hypothetical protein [Spirillospora sp.]